MAHERDKEGSWQDRNITAYPRSKSKKSKKSKNSETKQTKNKGNSGRKGKGRQGVLSDQKTCSKKGRGRGKTGRGSGRKNKGGRGKGKVGRKGKVGGKGGDKREENTESEGSDWNEENQRDFGNDPMQRRAKPLADTASDTESDTESDTLSDSLLIDIASTSRWEAARYVTPAPGLDGSLVGARVVIVQPYASIQLGEITLHHSPREDKVYNFEVKLDTAKWPQNWQLEGHDYDPGLSRTKSWVVVEEVI
jgi:hypothetical protein